MAKTISQRITLEGSEDIRRKLEELGKTGEQAFQKLQEAAKKPITDPEQIARTQKAVDELVASGTKLSQQFSALATNAKKFGTDGAQATRQVSDGLNQTNTAAQKAGQTIQQAGQQAVTAGQTAGAGLVSAATKFGIAAAAIYAAMSAITLALTKGAVESGTAIAEQAEKIKLSIPQWLALRQAIRDSTISNEDFVKSAGSIAGMMEKAAGGIARLASGTEQAVKFGDKFVTVYRGGAAAATKMQSESDKAATALRKMGASAEAIASGDTLRAMREVAENIGKIPDSLKQAEAGTAAFGKNWEAMVKVLLSTKAAVDGTTRSLAEQGRANRDMTADQVAKTQVLKTAWADLKEAVRATKDQVGALFLDPALARAEWLTKLIDGSRQLLRQWVALDQQGRKTFVVGLGTTATEAVFKIMIAVSKQLAGIWEDILIPAGEKLIELVTQVADNLEGVSKSDVAAFFITAAIAAAGLAVALKAIGFLLTPVTLLISLFTGFGPILIALGGLAFVFWDQIKTGAEGALKAVAPLGDVFRTAVQQLLAGDFKGFWENFSGAAIASFNRIKQAILEENPALAEFFAGVAQMGQQISGAIKLLIDALAALGRAAVGVANVINFIFGTKLTGTDIALIAIVAQLTGGLAALASVATVVAATMTVLGVAFGVLATVIGGVPAAIVAVSVVIAGAVAAWLTFSDAGQAAVNVVIGAIDGLIGIIGFLIDKLKAAWEWASKLFSTSGSGGAAADRPGMGSHARGGLLGGRGSGTSDSNLAWVSRGEHIMPARAVRQPGVLAFLEALRRSGGDLRHVLDGLRGFAHGGLVTMPAFASGGINGMSNVTIQFPGLPAIGGLRASAAVVEELRKAAAMAQVRSGGRKPSRYS